MASCLRGLRKWRLRMRGSLSVIKSGVVICTLFALDIRDVVYKVLWIGPGDAFHFRTDSTVVLQSEALVPAMTAQNDSLVLASGWPSFLSRCDSITPFCSDGSTFFLSALLTNCSAAGGDELPQSTATMSLVLTTNARVDSLAWASCKLLFVSRRPPVCQEDIVANFNTRYALPNSEIPVSWMTPVESSSEIELLQFLDMVSLSVPYHKIVCGEAFAFDPEGHHDISDSTVFKPTIYGCASPNLHRSEFLGLENPLIANLQRDKAWLTADVVQFMGIQYGIRQNCESELVVSHDSRRRTLLSFHSKVNFSSFGQLYVLLVLIDVSLLLLHFLSSVEIFTWVLLPEAQEVREQLTSALSRTVSQIKLFLVNGVSTRRLSLTSSSPTSSSLPPLTGSLEKQQQPEGLLEESLFYSFFSRSLYRSQLVVLATIVTQLISWLLVLPNSVVWTWSDSVTEKLQAYLSSIRVWVLILLLTNALWNVVVLANEELAYNFVKGTFVSSFEILLIGALVSFVLRDKVFAMCEIKWAIERQRVNDVSSFPGYIAHANTFSLAQDQLVSTPTEVFWVIYEPLLHILAWSFVALMFYAVAKSAIYAKGGAWVRYAWSKLSSSRLGRKLAVVYPVTNRQQQQQHHHHLTQRIDEETAQAYHNSSVKDKPATNTHLPVEKRYERSQIERILDCPVRAKSLIRNTLQMETTDAASGHVHISPSCYLDFGVMMRNGEVRSRICFSDVLVRAQRPDNELSVALEDHPQNLRRRSSVFVAHLLKGHQQQPQQSKLLKRKRSSSSSWISPNKTQQQYPS